MRLAPWVVVVTLASACTVPRPYFECLEDDWSRCGPGGACEPGTGSCSYADDSCTSGRRFSELARAPYAEACVALEAAPERGQLCTTTASCTEGRQCLGGRCLSIESFTANDEFFCAECANHDAGRPTSSYASCWGLSTVIPPQADSPLVTNSYDCDAATPTNCPTECGTCPACPTYCLSRYHLDSISVGASYLCFDDGRTSCLGANAFHQTMDPNAGPFGVRVLPVHYTRLATGTNHTCASAPTAPDAVDCWGSTSAGQLGIDAIPQPGSTPTAVRSFPFPPAPNIVAVEKIAVGGELTCASSSDDRLRCWGSTGSIQPGLVTLPPGPLRGLDAGRDHVCVLKGGSVWCWGANERGQAAPADPAPTIAVPTEVMPGTEFVAIATGRDHSCAVTAVGAIHCWGSSDRGQLGEGNAGPGPVVVRTDPPAVGPMNAGSNVTCALHADDRTRCWGAVFSFNGKIYDDFETCVR